MSGNNNKSVNGTNGQGMNVSSTPTVSNFPNVYVGNVMRVDSVNNHVGFNNAYLQNVAFSDNSVDAATVGQIIKILFFINKLSSNLNNLAQSFYGNSNTILVNPATDSYTIPNNGGQTLTDLTMEEVNENLKSDYGVTSQFFINHPASIPVNDQPADIYTPAAAPAPAPAVAP
jgi:hypothetical protein